jgi:hypothetical protein
MEARRWRRDDLRKGRVRLLLGGDQHDTVIVAAAVARFEVRKAPRRWFGHGGGVGLPEVREGAAVKGSIGTVNVGHIFGRRDTRLLLF